MTGERGDRMLEGKLWTVGSAVLALASTVAGAASAASPENLELLLLLGALVALTLCRKPGRS
jgi:hypothetical protein